MPENQVMFYEVDKIESNLVCPKCQSKYKSPRILPCGKNLCQSCVDELAGGEKRLKCPFCRKTHHIPDEGFILNEFIIKCLEIKPQKVYR